MEKYNKYFAYEYFLQIKTWKVQMLKFSIFWKFHSQIIVAKWYTCVKSIYK